VAITAISLVVFLKPSSASVFELNSFRLSGNTGLCDDYSSQVPCSIPINANITLSDYGWYSRFSSRWQLYAAINHLFPDGERVVYIICAEPNRRIYSHFPSVSSCPPPPSIALNSTNPEAWCTQKSADGTLPDTHSRNCIGVSAPVFRCVKALAGHARVAIFPNCCLCPVRISEVEDGEDASV
jgi:hypothetical protein